MNKRASIYVSVGLLVAAGMASAGYFMLSQKDSVPVSNISAGAVFAAVDEASTSAASITSHSTQPPPNTKEYQSATYHFLLYYPRDLSMREQSLTDNSIALGFQDQATQDGFEIFITPYQQPAITQARFLLDEPSDVMNDPVYVLVDGTPATEFLSTNPAMGPSREIWFLHGGFLYEVTTPQPLDSWLLQIMETWHFT